MSKSDKTSTFRPIAGWNDYLKEHYSVAQDALWWWKLYNRPKMVPFTIKCKVLKHNLNMHSVLLESVKQ